MGNAFLPTISETIVNKLSNKSGKYSKAYVLPCYFTNTNSVIMFGINSMNVKVAVC